MTIAEQQNHSYANGKAALISRADERLIDRCPPCLERIYSRADQIFWPKARIRNCLATGGADTVRFTWFMQK